MSPYDIGLLLVVTVQATIVAYLHSPTLKAWALTVPAPFALATLALGRPVDATFLVGLLLMVAFTLAVWYLHVRRRWPIIAAIVTAAAGYTASAGLAVRLLAADPHVAFLPLLVGVLAISLALFLLLPPGSGQRAHRSPLPVWVKLPILLLVVAFLLVLKKQLAGAMATFPMVGVISCYEMRHSLWTQFRQMPVIMLGFTAMLGLMHLLGDRGWPLPAVLGLGVLAYLGVCLLLAGHRRWATRRAAATATPDLGPGTGQQ